MTTLEGVVWLLSMVGDTGVIIVELDVCCWVKGESKEWTVYDFKMPSSSWEIEGGSATQENKAQGFIPR